MRSTATFALTISGLAAFVYFVGVAIWFTFVGRFGETPRRRTLTFAAFGAVASSCAMYVAAMLAFGYMSSTVERIFLWTSLVLCGGAITVVGGTTPRARIPIVLLSLFVIVNWVGSVFLAD